MDHLPGESSLATPEMPLNRESEFMRLTPRLLDTLPRRLLLFAMADAMARSFASLASASFIHRRTGSIAASTMSSKTVRPNGVAGSCGFTHPSGSSGARVLPPAAPPPITRCLAYKSARSALGSVSSGPSPYSPVHVA